MISVQIGYHFEPPGERDYLALEMLADDTERRERSREKVHESESESK